MARPSVFTEDTLQKLEQAFAQDCTDEEACLYADIAPSTLYAYQTKNKEFLERKQLLRQRPVLKARMELITGFVGNPAICLKYLERKKPDEFKPILGIESPTLKQHSETEVDKLRDSLRRMMDAVKKSR